MLSLQAELIHYQLQQVYKNYFAKSPLLTDIFSLAGGHGSCLRAIAVKNLGIIHQKPKQTWSSMLPVHCGYELRVFQVHTSQSCMVSRNLLPCTHLERPKRVVGHSSYIMAWDFKAWSPYQTPGKIKVKIMTLCSWNWGNFGNYVTKKMGAKAT